MLPGRCPVRQHLSYQRYQPYSVAKQISPLMFDWKVAPPSVLLPLMKSTPVAPANLPLLAFGLMRAISLNTKIPGPDQLFLLTVQGNDCTLFPRHSREAAGR